MWVATLTHVTTLQALRRAARLLVVTTMIIGSALGAALINATAAGASNGYEEASDPGTGLTVVQTLGLYVGLPAAIFALIALIVVGPSLGKGPRHRTGTALETGPVWIDPAGVRRTPATTVTPGSATEQGGTSAHW